MSKGYVSYRPEGRLGNALYQASAAMAYAWDHGMEFSMPTTSRDPKWCPTYLPHLAKPDYDPSLPVIMVEERGYRFQKLPWDDRWKDGHNIVLNGFFQSPKYWQHHRDRILESFGFQWRKMEMFWCAVHVRRGDALRYPEKHLLQTKEWIEAQMRKFPHYSFRFFSDDYPWCREQFGHRIDCYFDDFPRCMEVADDRPEVQDLVDAACCSHLIGSSSTFAAWIYFLNRNPNKRAIFPKEWLKTGWEGTTQETWRDVLPMEVERA